MRIRVTPSLSLLLLGLLQVQAFNHNHDHMHHSHATKQIDCNGPIQKLQSVVERMGLELTEMQQNATYQKQELEELLKVTLQLEVKRIYKLILEQMFIRNKIPAEPVFNGNLKCVENCGNPKNIPQNCNNAREDGVYLLSKKNNGVVPFGAYCIKQYNDDQRWIVVQRRFNGKENFNRNWLDYRNGFGYPDGEYWLGLERLYALTKDLPFELWIHIRTRDNKTANARYKFFSLSDEKVGYKLRVNHFESATLNNCLRMNSDRAFSTFDNKHEAPGREMNCASNEKGGWWYSNDCSWCNLNGMHYASADAKSSYGIYWRPNLSDEIIQYTHMAIRPRLDVSYS